MEQAKQHEEEINLLDYWKVIVKRKWILITFTGILMFLAGIFSFLATPKYQAKTTLLIEEEASRILSIEDEFGYRAQRTDLRYFNTQLRLIESKSLAERVARKMDLLSRPEFQKKQPPEGIPEGTNVSAGTNKNERALDPYREVGRSILSNLEVSPIRDTKLVEVSYKSRYPLLAAELVNTLADEFINFSVEKRYETTQQASDFLSESIANLREDLAAKERELQRYGQEKDMVFLSDKESTAVDKLSDVNTAFTQAQIDRIQKEAAYRELRNLDVDSLPQSVNNPLIQSLKTDYTRMKNEYEEKRKIYKPNYPEMVRLKARLDSMSNELRNEIQKAVEAAESEYRSALQKENSLRNLLDAQRQDVAQLNSNAILYNSLKIEVENKRKLLNTLVEQQNQTLVSARLGGLKASNISIIDRADVPKHPVSPRKKMNLILAFLIGILGGTGLCFVAEYLDNTIKEPEDVERLAQLPSLGIVPFLSPNSRKHKSRYGSYQYAYGKENPGTEEKPPEIKEVELVNHLHPKFAISEDYRTIRTSILFSHADNPPKSIVFSSASPSEGKTATVANMAVSFAQLQQKVLVIDADMRKPRLHRIFKVRNIKGLSSYLTGKIPLNEIVQKTNIENIHLIASGPVPPNPAELLNSKSMRILMEEMKNIFDIVLIDTPPVLAVIDPVIASSLSESMVFIVQAGKTTQKPFLKAVEELSRAKANIIGVVFNEAKVRKEGYASPYYRYYHYETDEREE